MCVFVNQYNDVTMGWACLRASVRISVSVGSRESNLFSKFVPTRDSFSYFNDDDGDDDDCFITANSPLLSKSVVHMCSRFAIAEHTSKRELICVIRFNNAIYYKQFHSKQVHR